MCLSRGALGLAASFRAVSLYIPLSTAECPFTPPSSVPVECCGLRFLRAFSFSLSLRMVGSGPLAAIPRKVGCDEASSASKPSLNVISSELLASVNSCLGGADKVDVRVDELSACDEEFSDARAGEEEESFANKPAIMSRSSGVLELLLWVDLAVGDSGRCPIWIGVVVDFAKIDGSVWEGTISRSEDGRQSGAFFLAIRRAGKGGEFLNVLTRLRISEQTCKEVLMDERLMTGQFP